MRRQLTRAAIRERCSMTSTAPDDNMFQQLMQRVRSGDQEAAAELVRLYEPTIRRIARVRLADAHLQRQFDSMDICQSVLGSFFVRAALGQYELTTPDQLLSLLVSMSRKKLIDLTRRAGAARRDYRRLEKGAPDERQCVAGELSPSQQVAGEELLVEFRKRLSEEERRLADQRAAGHDWNQIAVTFGGSPEALRKQLARAVDRVSCELGLDDLDE
jgi:RNA polymerase sigma-70 factor (ECF subfamily)